MVKVLIGSTALKHWFPDFTREPKDVDYAVDAHVTKTSKEVELLYNPVFIKLFRFKDGDYAHPTALATLKASHLRWDINWPKHMYDLQFLLKKGYEPDWNKVQKLMLFWEEYLPTVRRSNLTLDSKNFFTNAIKSEFEHDFLHSLLKNPPTYLKVLKDGAEVEPDANKFHKLEYEEKLNLVKEEVWVMAFERYNKLYYKEAYTKMLQKFIIAHAPQFEYKFILLNYRRLLRDGMKFNFIKHLENELCQLQLKP